MPSAKNTMIIQLPTRLNADLDFDLANPETIFQQTTRSAKKGGDRNLE